MKKSLKISGIMLIILLSACFTSNAQRGFRGMRPDSLRMKSDTAWNSNTAHRNYSFRHDSSFMNRRTGDFRRMGPGHGQGLYAMRPMHQGRNMMPPRFGREIQPGMRHMPQMAYGGGREMAGQGRRMLENIPGLTDKQKEELSNIMEKQRQDMQNLMKERQEKIRQLRESNRSKILNLLNSDQKIWFEEHEPAR